MRSPLPSLPVVVGIAAVVALALVDSGQIRERAAVGLSQGMPPREAALARGFVLGEDEGVEEGTKEEFRRSGLAHLLAVSGQNVTLLALLAMPLLAALGIPLRARLVWVLALIAVYVPVAGAGPSIQRAGVMGAIGVLATLGGRRSSHLYALVTAALVTAAIDPDVSADVGWQLSFAAVLGILLLASPLRRAILARWGEGNWRRALADSLALAVAATIATAPLIAHHFGTVSMVAPAANVLALPAVAPAMWLGMLGAALAQVPGLPVAPLNGLNALLLAYIAQIASWCAAPGWAQSKIDLGAVGVFASYLGIAVACLGAALLGRFRPGALRSGVAAMLLGPPLVVGALLVAAAFPAGGSDPISPGGLRIEVLDVGQGDSILLRPAAAPAILVDGGPSVEDLAAKLEGAGVEALGAAVITHDQADHAAGVEGLFGRVPIGRLVFAHLDRPTLGAAARAGIEVERVAAGSELRSGALRLQVLWPPRELLAAGVGRDPNREALVLEVRWHRFGMLLTADAEAESVPLDPGPVDVLKVAHHGSDDAGLGPLLDEVRPQLAVISVGADNAYGHPTPATIATLARHSVPTLRTDVHGDVVLEVDRGSFRLDG